MSQIQYAFNKNDEYYTPEYAVEPIIKYIKSGSKVWCPFDTNQSNFVKVLSKNGFIVVNTHVLYGQDFFEQPVPNCDYIISNPPYSLKGDVFKKLYEIGKPFAMLINFQGIFDNKKRFEMFKENKVEMLWISPRIDYITDKNKKYSGVPFQSGYLCSNILPTELCFEYVQKQ